jgi:hypothetical protein
MKVEMLIDCGSQFYSLLVEETRVPGEITDLLQA